MIISRYWVELSICIFKRNWPLNGFNRFLHGRIGRCKNVGVLRPDARASCRLAVQSGTRDVWSDLRHLMWDYF